MATNIDASWTRLRSSRRPSAPASSTRGRPSTTSSPSIHIFRRTRCSSATSRRRRRTCTSGRGSSTSHRRSTILHASRSGLRCSTTSPRAASSSAWVAVRRLPSRRASVSPIPTSRATCSTRSWASSARCGGPRSTRDSTASSSRCPRATCCPSRSKSRTRRLVFRVQQRVLS